MSGIELGVWASLALYFLLMIGIGIYAFFEQNKTSESYMLGGRTLSPAVMALSVGASDMSGWLLLGLPGYMYASGVVSIWIALGLTIGAFANYMIVAPRLRIFTELAGNSITLPDYFSNRFHDQSNFLRIMSAIVIILFFTVYTAAGLVAGGKLFEGALNASYGLGLWITAGVVVGYTLLGGFLAVSMADFVQGIIMVIAMILVPVVAFSSVGGLSEGLSLAQSVNPEIFNWTHGLTTMGVISLMAWGFGYFGQPHIIVRFMAIRSAKDTPKACAIGMSWMVVSLIGGLMVGLAGVAFVAKNNIALDDPERIFLVLSKLLFHPLISGFLLAAIMAAIMSTLSSQLLVVSSSLTRDVYKLFFGKEASEARQVMVGQISVAIVALIAIMLAGNKDSSVLQLVSHAWAGFGAAFGPLVILSLTWKRMNRNGALAGMIVGALTVIFWVYGGIHINGQPANDVIYSILPGVLFSTIAIIAVSLKTPPLPEHILTKYDEMEKRLKSK